MSKAQGDEKSPGSKNLRCFEDSRVRSLGNQMRTAGGLSEIDIEQYIERAQGFAFNMPAYLGGRATIGYPDCPESWNGPFELVSLDLMAAALLVNA